MNAPNNCSGYRCSEQSNHQYGTLSANFGSTKYNWIDMLNEAIYSANLTGAFVCDRYNGNYFHMNWGWSGSYDGYFLISALKPGGVGTGGGTGGYNDHQHALFGVKLHQTETQQLEIMDMNGKLVKQINTFG